MPVLLARGTTRMVSWITFGFRKWLCRCAPSSTLPRLRPRNRRSSRSTARRASTEECRNHATDPVTRVTGGTTAAHPRAIRESAAASSARRHVLLGIGPQHRRAAARPLASTQTSWPHLQDPPESTAPACDPPPPRPRRSSEAAPHCRRNESLQRPAPLFLPCSFAGA